MLLFFCFRHLGHRPRRSATRILAAAGLSVVVALSGRLPTLALTLAVAVVGAILARLKPRSALRRLAPLNLFMLLVLVLTPLTDAGSPLFTLGPLSISRRGLLLAGTIALKGNAIVLGLVVLLGSLHATTVGHALHHLRVPEKLVHLLLFTVRYIDVLGRESRRLLAAMRVRGFRADEPPHLPQPTVTSSACCWCGASIDRSGSWRP